MKTNTRREKKGTDFGTRNCRDIVDNLPVGVYRTTADGRFLAANPALAEMLGVASPGELTEFSVKDFYVDLSDRTRHLKKLQSRPIAFDEFQLRRVDGSIFWCRDYPRRSLDISGKVSILEGVIVDITERKTAEIRLAQALEKLAQANKKLKEMSLADELTGLHNRRGFLTLGQQHLKNIRRARKKALLLFLDMDGLKTINDKHGHAVGDDVLAAFGKIMKTTLRESDISGRIGGDEFAAILAQSPKGDERSVIKRLRKSIATFNVGECLPVAISVSIGSASFTPTSDSLLEELMYRADLDMYKDKIKRRKRSQPLTKNPV